MSDTLKSIANAVISFAPTVATLLGGPMVGEGVTMLEGVLGLTPAAGSTIATRADAIQKQLTAQSMTTDQMIALKTLDAQHAEKMKSLDIDLSKITNDYQASMAGNDVADRSSARLRESNVKDNTPKVLAYVIVAGFLAMVFTTLMGYSKVESVLAGTLIGYLSAKCEQVVAYYFGSSSGAARGQELLAQSTPSNGPIGVTSK